MTKYSSKRNNNDFLLDVRGGCCQRSQSEATVTKLKHEKEKRTKYVLENFVHSFYVVFMCVASSHLHQFRVQKPSSPLALQQIWQPLLSSSRTTNIEHCDFESQAFFSLSNEFIAAGGGSSVRLNSSEHRYSFAAEESSF
jgi:hypothetical protein